MFYEGTLQDGISTAVGQQKLVLCFVTDDGEESNLWESEFLVDESVVELIKDQSIALRLKAGSDEAGYLAQIFPLPRTPTVVIIKNGELKEYITPETSKEDFLRRIQNSFSAPTSSSQPAPASAPQPEPAPTTTTTTTSSEPASSSRRETSTSENVRRILAERAKHKAEKEEAERKAQKERKAQEERAKAKGKGRAEAEDAGDTNNDGAHKAAEAVKKRRQQEQEERRRILARIEADKAERKLQAAAREQQRLEDQQTGDSATSSLTPEKKIVPSSTKKASGMTAVQVRLFDGSTIRSRFKSEAPLKDVRTWVDESRTDGTQPYTFKQVLTPMPNKAIDATEENNSVGELGLSPSSTLVLIPVQHYSSAYDGSSQGVVSKIIGFFLGILYWFLGLFTSGDGQGATNGPASTSENQESSQDRSRIQRFQNQNDRLRDQQLYNGNSVSPAQEGFM
ncbi:ubiquitin-related domain-containing protein [Thelonectria olida]|uniref:UBX domain-containing protein 2 n=1 Tax=Thelonectria olida TaxID=1576542 RepID=A0A9P9AG60_9HYPO|nr:ubiquitin-related domain-containing protein [Thelonectria olida]